jgi:hypothetical protein
MCASTIRPSSSAARWWGERLRMDGWLSGVSIHRRTHDSPRGAEAVDEARIFDSNGYGVGGSDKRVKLVTSIVRNIGVRGGSRFGSRKSASKLYARVGAP